MYAFVKGYVTDLEADNVVIDSGNIGYNVKISESTAAELSRRTDEVKLYTYTLVREDAICLFGFLSKEELWMFKKLITVNGIGPKGALAILSVLSVSDLRFAIFAGDSKLIASAPGIGKKTAERVILDLKDKVDIEDNLIALNSSDNNVLSLAMSSEKEIAIEGLVALGYSHTEAVNLVKKVSVSEDMDSETILKSALKFI